MNPANPYAVLGVAEDASAQEIKKAYRRQMRLAAVDTHPDVSDAEREVLQERMVEVNRAFEVLSGPGRESVDGELRRQRAAEARLEEELRREQARQQAVWEAAQRRASQARDRERVAHALKEAALEQERLHRVRRQAQEHARRTAQTHRDNERRYQEAAWVREYMAEGPGYRHEVRVEGPAGTEEMLDALWDLLAPRAGQDVHETIEVTQGQWASGAAWTSGIDGLPLTGLEHSPPATYGFRGRGAPGVYGGPRGDHYVTVVHVDDFGQPVVGGFHAARRTQPVSRQPAKPAATKQEAFSPRRRRPQALVGIALRLVQTLLKCSLVVLAASAVLVVILVVVLTVMATKR